MPVHCLLYKQTVTKMEINASKVQLAMVLMLQWQSQQQVNTANRKVLEPPNYDIVN